jgi:hypothetical protein
MGWRERLAQLIRSATKSSEAFQVLFSTRKMGWLRPDAGLQRMYQRLTSRGMLSRSRA